MSSNHAGKYPHSVNPWETLPVIEDMLFHRVGRKMSYLFLQASHACTSMINLLLQEKHFFTLVDSGSIGSEQKKDIVLLRNITLEGFFNLYGI